jgi:hypothetical protein
VNETNRRRIYAPDCPFEDERKKAYFKERMKLQRQQRKAEQMFAPHGPGRGHHPSAMDSHRFVRVCKTCANLPERRPPAGCPRCDGPAGPPAPIRPFIQGESALGMNF